MVAGTVVFALVRRPGAFAVVAAAVPGAVAVDFAARVVVFGAAAVVAADVRDLLPEVVASVAAADGARGAADFAAPTSAAASAAAAVRAGTGALPGLGNLTVPAGGWIYVDGEIHCQIGDHADNSGPRLRSAPRSGSSFRGAFPCRAPRKRTGSRA